MHDHDDLTRESAGAPRISWIAPNPPWPTPVRAGLSCRTGGVSRSPFASLNLGGVRTGDVHRNRVENLARLGRATGLDFSTAARIRLQHEVEVLVAREGGFQGDGDALVTGIPGLVLALTVADCVPVVIADPLRGVALVHCGWRSTAAGIVERSMRALLTLEGVAAENCWAWIGPGIGPCCFEVGPEVADRFGPVHRRGGADAGAPVHVDLPGSIKAALRGCGLRDDRILRSALCTACRGDLFYSHRRDRGRTGRMLAWVVREESVS